MPESRSIATILASAACLLVTGLLGRHPDTSLGLFVLSAIAWLGLVLGGLSFWRKHARLCKELDSLRIRQLDSMDQGVVQRLIDVIPYPIYIKDANSRYLLLNNAFCKERGQSMRDLLGKTSFDLAPSREVADFVAQEDAAVIAGQHVFKEEQNRHPVTGLPRYRIVSKVAYTDSQGTSLIVGANIDVTSWRVAEQTLQHSLDIQSRTRAYLQSVFNAIPDPIFVKDQEHRYLMLNTAYQKLFCQPTVRIIGQRDQQLLDVPLADALEGEERLLLTRPAGTVLETELSLPCNGESQHFLVHRILCADNEGRPVIIGVLGNVTSLLQAEERWMHAKEEAERANQAKSVFLANMSHELRTPMHAVLSFAQLGQERFACAEPEKLRHYFEQIVHSGSRLLRLLNDLLDLSKLEAGHADLNIQPTPVTPLLREVSGEFEALLASRQQCIQIVGTCDEPVAADGPRLGQVLRNLIGNASRFSPPGTAIRIGLSDAEMRSPDPYAYPVRALQITVADEGAGIPSEELETVFERFMQSSTLKSAKEGTGLGLPISRQIVRAHGGEIFARNKPGQGAEFVVRIPLVRQHQQLAVA